MKDTIDPNERTLTTRDVARMLGLTPAGVSYSVRAGLLSAARLPAGQYRFSLSEVAARLQSKRSGSTKAAG